MSKRLYVGNISYSATADELRAHFANAGGVDAVDRLTERRTGRNRGFCFIEMESPQAAQNAVDQLNGIAFQERNLRVTLARPNDE
ncbi:MAG: RNA-binding protein [Verrucomicrobiales bacterium]|nr:RNA-binding protein [Verrucomicrobiales bacterium]|tara:strand:- start:2786 stop:3040 length:255 start_codon:yes stop_codon:yes gene_type:complete